jgi:uncharacterized membrane protein (DUF2068 family)
MTDPRFDPRQDYTNRLALATAGYARVDARWNRVANARLAAFVGAAVGAAWGLWGRATLGWFAAGVLFVIFAALAVHHARLGRERTRWATLRAIQEEALARLDRRWDDLPAPWTPAVPADHPYAADLDIVGRASLWQLLDTTTTAMGRETLADGLLAPAALAVVRVRQGAVSDLATRLDLRQELELRGRLAAGDGTDPAPFLTWAEASGTSAVPGWLRWFAWVSPAILAALAVAQLAGLVAQPLWVIPFFVNLIAGATAGRRAYSAIAGVASDHRAIAAYAGQLELLAAAEFSDPALQTLQADLGHGKRAAPEMLRRLGRMAGMAIPPGSILYLPLQATVMWDIHVLTAMERWRRDGGDQARRWLETLGEAEALASFAGLRHDHPDWVFPTVDAADDAFRAEELGHPLLPDHVRVRNDVVVGPPGTFLLVTGSNMSGKSTLLRAIGVNTVLAQAGGPVCAEALTLPSVALWTSVRVQDSLERGVSFFMADLQRLKLVVDAATRARDQGGARVLYLLDEILQGTNTAERSIAARRIIGYLVEQGAIGAVSTHDLTLADDPRLEPAALSVHFTDTVGEGPHAPPMSFDYRLRPGVATTTNALRLMRLIGLELEDAPV